MCWEGRRHLHEVLRAVVLRDAAGVEDLRQALAQQGPDAVSALPCNLATCECAGIDLSALAGRAFTTTDGAENTYVVALCGEVPKAELPAACRLGTQRPSVVRYSDLGCVALASAGPSCGTDGSANCGMWATPRADGGVDVAYTTDAASAGMESATTCYTVAAGQHLHAAFTASLTHLDCDLDTCAEPGPGQVEDAPCDSVAVHWPTVAVLTAEQEETKEELNALWITGPFFAILAGTAITFVRKARAGTGNMPFGLPSMTADQLNTFGLCYATYMFYHALRAGFSGCKSSMVSESGFTKQQMGNMDTGFLLAYAWGQFYWGSMADKVSAKITTVNGMYAIAGVVIFYTTAEVVGLSPTVTLGAVFFVVARIAEGFLQATGWSGTLAMTSDWFGAAHRGAVMGVMSTDSNVGNIVGEIVVGSVFAVNGGWQLCLLILASLLAVMGYINSSKLVYPPPPDWELPADQQAGVKDRAEATSESSDGSEDGAEPITIMEAARIPGVVQYAMSYCFLKLVTYSLLFWLPFYLFEGAGLPKSLAALMATLNDIGMVAGGITAGWLSDKLTHIAKKPVRTPIVVAGLLAAIVPVGFLTVTRSPILIGLWITLAGFFLGMPAECSTSAVCVDLAKSQPKAATATVIGIIDGTGAFGAAVGQQVVAYVSNPAVGGWEAVFDVLVIALLLAALMVLPMARKDWSYLQAGRKGQADSLMLETGAHEGAPDNYAPPVMEPADPPMV